ncbi:MAG: PilX N-terminal domain-containing pilus assembly protein, partial [bacterium]|nr:PilX N-terminal domain-containing pilus assembly protein [bacterium]
MNTENRKGVALVIVIVLVLLFSIIILSVVLTSTAAYRRSAYFRDRNIAFNLAHLGIADALYKLNYRYHDPDHYYGFRSNGECLILTDGYPQNNKTYTYTLNAKELGFPHASINDGVTVNLIINDGTYPDTLMATGKYRGRTV